MTTKRFVMRKTLIGKNEIIEFTNKKGITYKYDHDAVYSANQQKLETMECWQLALNAAVTPSIIALSRQNLPLVRLQVAEKNLSGYGGYILKNSQKSSADITIVATGSEVSLALEAQKLKLNRFGGPFDVPIF